MDKLRKNILVTFLIIFSISIVAFSIFCYLDWSLLTGFLIGSCISVSGYLITELFSSKLLSKRRTFKFAFVLVFMKSTIWLLVFSGIFIGILFANNTLGNSWTNGIFNIFSFIYGSSMIWLSIIIYNFIEMLDLKFKKRKEKGIDG
ncbi:MAG: hypothetical protein HDR43_01700 [Mycoplasma sp.]|nr:hypothetical protein [Mycoplasma sp.]